MNSIKGHLQRSNCKKESLLLRDNILRKPELFEELVLTFLESDGRLTQRSAGVIYLCVQKEQDIIKPYLPLLLNKLREPAVPDVAKRNTVRILQLINIPEELEGEVLDICFTYLENPKEAVAIKAFSMTIIFRLSKKYPDLRNGLRILIEDGLLLEKAAFVSRGSKILEQLDKM